MNETPDARTIEFLKLVPQMNWRSPPSVWNAQVRAAIGDQLVTFGFGGPLKLTEKGREIVRSHGQSGDGK